MNTQKSSSGLQAFRPIIFIFIIVSSGLIAGKSLLARWNISSTVAIAGHLILFFATALSFYFYYKSLQSNKPQSLLRYIYAGMFVKLLACLFSAFLYIMIAGKTVNKGAIIVCLALYLLYTFLEVSILMKLSKQKKNA